MRRAEMARRRKNLSEKRNEEEKVSSALETRVPRVTDPSQMDTINRLLKKQPPKRGRKAFQEITDGQEDDAGVERAHPLYVRYTQNAKGTTLAIPDEWLQAPAGTVLSGTPAVSTSRPFSGRMVEEVA
jgi:Ino eighty subunit 2